MFAWSILAIYIVNRLISADLSVLPFYLIFYQMFLCGLKTEWGTRFLDFLNKKNIHLDFQVILSIPFFICSLNFFIRIYSIEC
jgi:hypothetical protein